MPTYNVMGVAKAALEASVRYLAADLGRDAIRVNAISAGPMRTLAGSAVGDARTVFKWNRAHSPLKKSIELDQRWRRCALSSQRSFQPVSPERCISSMPDSTWWVCHRQLTIKGWVAPENGNSDAEGVTRARRARRRLGANLRHLRLRQTLDDYAQAPRHGHGRIEPESGKGRRTPAHIAAPEGLGCATFTE